MISGIKCMYKRKRNNEQREYGKKKYIFTDISTKICNHVVTRKKDKT